MKFSYLTTYILGQVAAESITLGVFSDIHLKLDYFPFYATNDCTQSAAADADLKA